MYHKKIKMKILKLNLNLEGFSINQMYGKDHRLTTAARRWQLECKKQLMQYEKDLQQFKEQIQINEHYLKAHYTFIMPHKKLFTVNGKVSHQSKDLDGLLKILQDSIFNLMVMDDTIVCEIAAKKLSGSDFAILVEFHLCNINELA
jgi:Holliday junction resolvase RusA-like endonuclease